MKLFCNTKNHLYSVRARATPRVKDCEVDDRMQAVYTLTNSVKYPSYQTVALSDLEALLALGDSVILFDDFNFKNPRWRYPVANCVGNKLIRLENKLNYEIIVLSSSTYYPGNPSNRPSMLDITIVKGIKRQREDSECLADSIESRCFYASPPLKVLNIHCIEEEGRHKASLEPKDDLLPVSLSEVQTLIKSFKTRKTPGLDGSTLSPLLYSAYINDIPDLTSDIQLTLFEDDTLLYYQARHKNQFYSTYREPLISWVDGSKPGGSRDLELPTIAKFLKDASKRFFDIAESHPNALLSSAVSHTLIIFFRMPRNILSDPPDALTAVIQSLMEVNDTNDRLSLVVMGAAVRNNGLSVTAGGLLPAYGAISYSCNGCRHNREGYEYFENADRCDCLPFSDDALYRHETYCYGILLRTV
ncbi:hypothetical protein EVAR_86054_1 [Eumeta japonica]|uniref:Endonuclease/exonuclease/phosphatase domain-containing protein n=1 Tax=Eumeta variegata TaxID=151549 RepID=A0A4C1UJ95_EUMVA|nr:hypothetical protein EVAR_86054_1 [Eumeta japonica]